MSCKINFLFIKSYIDQNKGLSCWLNHKLRTRLAIFFNDQVNEDKGYKISYCHCVESVQIRSSGPYYPAFGLNTQYLSILSPNAGKYGPEKPPYLNTFRAVCDTPLFLIHFHQWPTFYVCFIKVYRFLILF